MVCQCDGHVECARPKSADKIDVEERYPVRCSSEESVQALNIIQCLSEHYGEEALFQTWVYYWTRQVKLGLTGLVIANMIESDLTCRLERLRTTWALPSSQ
jgi:hypothetical protein